jgi:hypothetical protein
LYFSRFLPKLLPFSGDISPGVSWVDSIARPLMASGNKSPKRNLILAGIEKKAWSRIQKERAILQLSYHNTTRQEFMIYPGGMDCIGSARVKKDNTRAVMLLVSVLLIYVELSSA